MSTRILDHIVHLTPPGSIPQTVDQFRALGFRGYPRRRPHIERACPSSPEREKRESHWWASKQPGWIDWAGLGTEDSPGIGELINKRAEREGTDVRYGEAHEGGRITKDGQVLKWRVTFPDAGKHGRGLLPFFCEDITPRERRVPLSPSNTQHPSTARGIAYLHLIISTGSDFAAYAARLTTTLGVQPSYSAASRSVWPLTTLKDDDRKTELILTKAEGAPQQNLVAGSPFGLWEVGIYVDTITVKEFPTGRIAWVPITD